MICLQQYLSVIHRRCHWKLSLIHISQSQGAAEASETEEMPETEVIPVEEAEKSDDSEKIEQKEPEEEPEVQKSETEPCETESSQMCIRDSTESVLKYNRRNHGRCQYATGSFGGIKL